MDSENPIKEYTGVWIPAEVMESEELSLLDKFVYAEMAGFLICYASNAWLAKKLGKSESSISHSVARLVKLGYVENLGFNGRARQLRVAKNCKAALQKIAKQPSQKLQHNNKEEYININNSENVKNDAVEKSEYGNHEINALLELWEHETGITANVAKANRLAAWNLLRRKGFDGAKAVIELCGRAIKSGDPYAPRIASFRDLQGKYEKLSKLEAWEARQNIPEQGITMSYYQNSPDLEDISDEERERVHKMIIEAKKDFRRAR